MVIGDVSGKGVPAGLVAASIQGRLQAGARMTPPDPAALAADLNRDVFGSIGGRRYATMVYGVLDPEAARLTVVNAGHPCPMVVPGGPRRIAPTGPAVGLIEHAAFETAAIDLPPGSVFVAVTDGVTEALDRDDRELGEEAAPAIAADASEQTAAEICARILAAVRAHRGDRRQEDDVTVMVVKRAGNREPGTGSRKSA